MAIDVHLDGLTLTVASVKRSLAFYGETIGFLAPNRVAGKAAEAVTPAMRDALHVELSTDDLDDLYLRARPGRIPAGVRARRAGGAWGTTPMSLLAAR